MRIVDSHFHWYPKRAFEELFAHRDRHLGVPGKSNLWRNEEGGALFTVDADWFDLDRQLGRMNGLGHEVDVVCSIGPYSTHFSDMPTQVGREIATLWNEEMAAAQRKYRGRFWGTAAIPLIDAETAIKVLDHAIGRLGLIGINLPGSIGKGGQIDAAYLEPFYDRVEQLDVPIFLHATDAALETVFEGYNGALFASLGRIVDVSVSVCRLVFSGIMERHPKLKVVVSHTGGALPYQSGRMDKNARAAKLPKPTSSYLKRMYTDTVSPHVPGIKFAIEYYGVDHVMYGTDFPCWDPATALQMLAEIELSPADREKILAGNAKRILGLHDRLACPDTAIAAAAV